MWRSPPGVRRRGSFTPAVSRRPDARGSRSRPRQSRRLLGECTVASGSWGGRCPRAMSDLSRLTGCCRPQKAIRCRLLFRITSNDRCYCAKVDNESSRAREWLDHDASGRMVNSFVTDHLRGHPLGNAQDHHAGIAAPTRSWEVSLLDAQLQKPLERSQTVRLTGGVLSAHHGPLVPDGLASPFQRRDEPDTVRPIVERHRRRCFRRFVPLKLFIETVRAWKDLEAVVV